MFSLLPYIPVCFSYRVADMIELSLDHLLGRKSKICYRLSFYRLFVGTPG